MGSEKTGTTFIQSTLNFNKKSLLDNGFSFPPSNMTIDGNFRVFAAAFTNPDNNDDDFFIAKNLSDKKSVLKWQNEARESIAKLFAESSGNMIISSEHLSSRLGQNEHKELNKFCLNYFDEIKIIYFIRNQFDLAISQDSNMVKFGKNTTQLAEPERFEIVGNYKRFIQILEICYGKENLNIRIYKKNSLLKIFLKCLNLNNFEPKINEERANQSLTNFSRAILVEINNILPFYVDGKVNKERKDIERYIEKRFPRGNKFLPPRAKKRLFLEHFEDSNKWVKDRYFPNQDVLFEANLDYKPNNQIKDITKDDVKDISEFIVELWKQKNQ